MATTIHHSTIKSAEKQGIVLSVDGAVVRAFIPNSATQAFGASGADAIKQVIAARDIYDRFNVKFKNVDDPKIHGYLLDAEGNRSNQQTTPVLLLDMVQDGGITWQSADEPQPTGEVVDSIEDTLEEEAGVPASTEPTAGEVASDFAEDAFPKDPPVVAIPPVKRAENGVALDGRVAYLEGTPAGDNPHNSETDDEDEYAAFQAWDEAWDAAADEKAEQEDDEKGGSVVSSRYRTKYKEEGHPNHCGDWLATLLNNYCIGDKNTDLAVFERICGFNGVDTSKYKREGVGWQGRIRMTGRNLLGKVVYRQGHIIVPDDSPEATTDRREITAPADWLSAQRYSKPEAK